VPGRLFVEPHCLHVRKEGGEVRGVLGVPGHNSTPYSNSAFVMTDMQNRGAVVTFNKSNATKRISCADTSTSGHNTQTPCRPPERRYGRRIAAHDPASGNGHAPVDALHDMRVI
jgi:hypothetical protein